MKIVLNVKTSKPALMGAQGSFRVDKATKGVKLATNWCRGQEIKDLYVHVCIRL
jgi:hypothetical protein